MSVVPFVRAEAAFRPSEKTITLLGATGSIGASTIDLLSAQRDRFRVEAVTAQRNAEGLAKVAEQYLKKGAKVYIEGQLQTRKWTDQSGAEKYTTEVVLQGFNSNLTMLDGRGGGGSFGADEGGGDFGSIGPSSAPAPRRAVPVGARNGDMDDDIPF